MSNKTIAAALKWANSVPNVRKTSALQGNGNVIKPNMSLPKRKKDRLLFQALKNNKKKFPLKLPINRCHD